MTDPLKLHMIREASRVLTESSVALAMLHSYFDDARLAGLPPHHAINLALAKIGTTNESTRTPGGEGPSTQAPASP